MIDPMVRRQLRSADRQARDEALRHVARSNARSVDLTVVDDLLALVAAGSTSDAFAAAVIGTPTPRLLAAYVDLSRSSNGVVRRAALDALRGWWLACPTDAPTFRQVLEERLRDQIPLLRVLANLHLIRWFDDSDARWSAIGQIIFHEYRRGHDLRGQVAEYLDATEQERLRRCLGYLTWSAQS